MGCSWWSWGELVNFLMQKNIWKRRLVEMFPQKRIKFYKIRFFRSNHYLRVLATLPHNQAPLKFIQPIIIRTNKSERIIHLKFSSTATLLKCWIKLRNYEGSFNLLWSESQLYNLFYLIFFYDLSNLN